MNIQPFVPGKIEELKTFFKRNAHAPANKKKNCIGTLNAGIELIYGDKILPLGNAIDKTMAILEEKGQASPPRVIEFKDQSGQVTYGEDRPHEIVERILAVMMEIVDCTIGWHIFALSVLDGYHSVTLLLDNTHPPHLEPEVYWCDHWKYKNLRCLGGTMKFGGCKWMNTFKLNPVITELTQRWWDREPDPFKKPKTRATLWRLIPPK